MVGETTISAEDRGDAVRPLEPGGSGTDDPASASSSAAVAPAQQSEEAPRGTEVRQSELPPLSIYHEAWWLDIAADAHWAEARIVKDGALIARLPYPKKQRFGLRISRLPSLIRTLGPAVIETAGKPAAALRRRLELTDQLIDQIPAFDSFDQIFDPRVPDAISFQLRGFRVGMTYAFQIDAGRTDGQVWSAMNDKTRNTIRKARNGHTLVALTDAASFARFYEANLEGSRNFHGAERLARLLEAILSRQAGTLLGAADPSGRLVAAACICWDAFAVRYFLSTRLPSGAGAASSLLVWEAARIACRRGVALDLDGITSPRNLLFLSGFGGKLVQRLRVRRENFVSRTAIKALRA